MKPDQAASFLRLTSFTDPKVLSLQGINKLVDPPFQFVSIQGRGTGLVANRTIKRGEWLMSSTPALMVAKEAMVDIRFKDRLHLQHLAVEQLPSQLRIKVHTLYNQKGHSAYDILDDILNTNSFQLPLLSESNGEASSSEADFKMLFPDVAVSGCP